MNNGPFIFLAFSFLDEHFGKSFQVVHGIAFKLQFHIFHKLICQLCRGIGVVVSREMCVNDSL